MSLYWVSEGVDHERRLRNGVLIHHLFLPVGRSLSNMADGCDVGEHSGRLSGAQRYSTCMSLHLSCVDF